MNGFQFTRSPTKRTTVELSTHREIDEPEKIRNTGLYKSKEPKAILDIVLWLLVHRKAVESQIEFLHERTEIELDIRGKLFGIPIIKYQ